MTRLSSQCLKCPVTALCATGEPSAVIVGQGSFVCLSGSAGGLDEKLRVFSGSNIHVIKRYDDKVLVIGGKSVAILQLEGHRLHVVLRERILEDWLLDGVTAQDGYQFLTAHNVVVETDAGLDTVNRHGCEEKCILYSGFLDPGSDGTCVFGGSVFSQILIWNVEKDGRKGIEVDSPVLHRLAGHEGVIFSINVNSEKTLICSTSDDRSARIWRVQFTEENSWETALIQHLYTCFGHTARVFRSCFVDSRLITVGEDSKICFWKLNSGNLERSIEDSHSGAQIWSMCLTGSNTLVTGGGNAAVARWSIAPPTEPRQLDLDISSGDYPKIIQYCNQRIFILTNNGELLAFMNEKLERRLVVHACKSYGVLASNDNGVVLLAALDGTVRILSSLTCDILLQVQVVQGKIFAAAIFEEDFLVNGPDGRLEFLKFSEKEAKVVAVGSLPEGKQRWFTVARKWEDNTLLGDRSGSLHLYSTDLNLVQSFRKIHGRNGVSDICTDRDTFLSCGRDGTVRRFAKCGAGVEQLSCIRTEFDWIARIVLNPGLQTVSFHGSRLVLLDVEGNRVSSKMECGGGHRSWDMVGSDQVFYIKDRKVYSQHLVNEGDLSGFQGSHTQHINCITAFRFREREFFCTGGEDTLMQIHELNPDATEWQGRLWAKGHVSSIKCMQSIQTKEEHLLVTGGGRAQLKVWKLLLLGGKIQCTELADYMLRGSDKSVKAPWRKVQSEVRWDPETRFLCLELARTAQGLYIYVGCSDSVLRIFRLVDQRIELHREIGCQEHCILRIKMFSLHGNSVLAFTTTGGSVFLFELGKDFVPELSCTTRLHQSGINCIDVRQMDGFALMATGGDDNALVISRIEYIDNHTSCQEIWRENRAHAAQITAVFFAGDNLLTVSIDQRLCVWKCSDETGESYKLKNVKCSNVSDIQDAAILSIDQKNLLLCAGVGLELFLL